MKLKAYQIAILIILPILMISLAVYIFPWKDTTDYTTGGSHGSFRDKQLILIVFPIILTILFEWMIYHHFKTGGKPDDEEQEETLAKCATGGEPVLETSG